MYYTKDSYNARKFVVFCHEVLNIFFSVWDLYDELQILFMICTCRIWSIKTRKSKMSWKQRDIFALFQKRIISFETYHDVTISMTDFHEKSRIYFAWKMLNTSTSEISPCTLFFYRMNKQRILQYHRFFCFLEFVAVHSIRNSVHITEGLLSKFSLMNITQISYLSQANIWILWVSKIFYEFWWVPVSFIDVSIT